MSEESKQNDSKAQTETERESENSQKNETDKQTELEIEKEKSKKKTEKSKKNESKIESKNITRRHYIIEREGNKIKKMIPLEELPAQPQTQQTKEGSNNWVWGVLAIVGIIILIGMWIWWFLKHKMEDEEDEG